MKKTICIVGTFDTKGHEYQYVKSLIEERGVRTYTIHTGVFEPVFTPDVSNADVASAAGVDIKDIAERKDRAWATEVLSKGMEVLLPKLYEQGKFDGVISLGGSGGTSLVTPGMRALPLGVPKVMVSTVASGNTAPYIGISDLIMIPSVVDVAGLNVITTRIISNAVFAIVGMVTSEYKAPTETKPLVAATMFGVTTPCVTQAQKYLEDRGYEVLVFHATGVGGTLMESLIDKGYFKGVLDITTTEWCDEVVGGVFAAGPNRSEAASRNKIPQVVSVGALDMVNYGAYDTVPDKFAGRNLYKHNPTITLMRTSVEENREIGKRISEKLNMADGDTALLLPLGGVSSIDVPGGPFYGPDENAELYKTLKENVGSQVEVFEFNCNINDQEFAEFAAQKLIDMMESKKS